MDDVFQPEHWLATRPQHVAQVGDIIEVVHSEITSKVISTQDVKRQDFTWRGLVLDVSHREYYLVYVLLNEKYPEQNNTVCDWTKMNKYRVIKGGQEEE